MSSTSLLTRSVSPMHRPGGLPRSGQSTARARKPSARQQALDEVEQRVGLERLDEESVGAGRRLVAERPQAREQDRERAAGGIGLQLGARREAVLARHVDVEDQQMV